jgi:hypothetical protein
MDNVMKAYKEAYRWANGENVIMRRHTRIRYVIQGDQREWTAEQIKGFTETLLKRESYQGGKV